MRESAIKTKCRKELKKWGWLFVNLIQTNENGIPDTMIMRGGVCIFLEFKRPGEKPDPLQIYRHDQLRLQGFHVFTVDSLSDIKKFCVLTYIPHATNTPNRPKE